MKAALRDEEDSCFDAIHQPVLFGDAARPIPGPLVAQRFGLAYAGKGMFLDVGNQPINAGEDPAIVPLPIPAILLRLGGPVPRA